MYYNVDAVDCKFNTVVLTNIDDENDSIKILNVAVDSIMNLSSGELLEFANLNEIFDYFESDEFIKFGGN
ncbi:MAG: hypothetical protein ACTSQY_00760 [Candidatus Odinarchaeia archaeon]